MSDEPVTVCTSCDAKVQRVLHPVAVHFKGSGFYTTDYARRGSDGDSSEAGKNGSDKAGSTSTKPDKAEPTAKPASSKKSESSD